jgi:hypothetical protein
LKVNSSVTRFGNFSKIKAYQSKNQQEIYHVIHYCGHIAYPVVVGVGNVLYHRRIYSYSTGHRHYHGTGPGDQRSRGLARADRRNRIRPTTCDGDLEVANIEYLILDIEY